MPKIPFSQLRFSQYARDLEQAIFRISQEEYTSITGLQSGAFQAMLDEMRKEIADAQAQGVADVKAAKVEATSEIKSTIANVKDKIKAEVSGALQEFSQFTNGGPALAGAEPDPAKPAYPTYP